MSFIFLDEKWFAFLPKKKKKKNIADPLGVQAKKVRSGHVEVFELTIK